MYYIYRVVTDKGFTDCLDIYASEALVTLGVLVLDSQHSFRQGGSDYTVKTYRKAD
jgi:hypothetical protein